MHAADELTQHLLGDVEVGDHAVPQGPAGSDRGGGATEHPLGLVADGEHAPGTRVLGDDRRLGHGDPPAAHEHERVRGTEIDGEVVSPAEPQPSSQGHVVGKR